MYQIWFSGILSAVLYSAVHGFTARPLFHLCQPLIEPIDEDCLIDEVNLKVYDVINWLNKNRKIPCA